DSENMRRVMGEQVEATPLTPEPGDVWPGPLPPEPTLQDLQQQAGQTAAPERAVPGSPDYRPASPPRVPPPMPTRGSSTPPGSSQPGLAPLPNPAAPQATNPTPPARN